MAPETPPLILEHDHGHGIIQLTLNRPRHLNAFNIPLYHAATTHLTKHTHLPTTRLIILTASGTRSFCAGLDIHEAADAKTSKPSRDAARTFMKALLDCRKIVMAACFGSVTGIGVTLCLHCDIVYASEAATFRTPFSSLGLVPEFGSSVTFRRNLGARLTAALLYQGASVPAGQLADAGFLEVVGGGREEVVERAVGEAVRWSARTAGDAEWEAVLDAKRLVDAAGRREVLEGMEREFEVLEEGFEGGRARLVEGYVERLRERKARL